MSKTKRTEQQRKESSPFSEEYYKKRNISLDQRDILLKKIKEKLISETKIEYYLNKGYSLEDAKKLRKERQKTFTLEKCKLRYGEERGYEIWKQRQDKWKAKVFNEHTMISSGYSKIALEFINDIFANEENINTDIFLYGKNEKFLYNKEYNKCFKYDLTNTKTKRIIEFNGDFWHMNPLFYKDTDIHKCGGFSAKEKWDMDNLKIETTKKHDYDIMVVWENEYLTNHDEIIKICKNFIL